MPKRLEDCGRGVRAVLSRWLRGPRPDLRIQATGRRRRKLIISPQDRAFFAEAAWLGVNQSRSKFSQSRLHRLRPLQ